MVRAWAALLLAAASARAELAVEDDAGQTLRLARPAERVVTLAPHLAELVAAVGGTAQLVGVSRHSDYPAEVAAKPSVGDAHAIDRERLLALKPDLLLVWRGGLSADRVEALRQLKIPVYQNDILKLADVASSLERIGSLLGRAEAGKAEAVRYRLALAEARRAPRGGQEVPAFYQIWHEPLYTLGEGHWLNDFLRQCGARNVFGGLQALAPPVSREAVLRSGAELVVLGSVSAEAVAGWKAFPAFAPQKHGRFCVVNPDWSERPGPRLALGVRELCACMARHGY